MLPQSNPPAKVFVFLYMPAIPGCVKRCLSPVCFMNVNFHDCAEDHGQLMLLFRVAVASMTVTVTLFSLFPPPLKSAVFCHWTAPIIPPLKPRPTVSLPWSSRLSLALLLTSALLSSDHPLVVLARLSFNSLFSSCSREISILKLVTVSDKLPLADCSRTNSSWSVSRRADDSLMVSSLRARNAR